MKVQLFWSTGKLLTDYGRRKLSGLLKRIPEITRTQIPLYNKTQPDILNIIIIDDAKMKELNRTYRKKNKTTDVLTFPFAVKKPGHEEPNIAEVYISGERAIEQSAEHKLPPFNEFVILIVHGIVHAFGYDHEVSEKESNKMKVIEEKIISSLGIKNTTPLTG